MAVPDFGYEHNIIPLKAPVDSAGTAFATTWIDMKNANWLTLYDWCGVISAASADQPVLVTVECATAAASGAEVAIAFKYRMSGVAAANTWGAVTSATSTGASFGTLDDGKIMRIDIDPAALEAALADARYVRLVQGIDAGGTVTLNAIWADLTVKYAQVTHISAT